MEIDRQDVENLMHKDADPNHVLARYNYLVKVRTHLSDDEINKGLLEEAIKGEASKSLNDLVYNMAQNYAYRKAKLDLNEFLARVESLNLCSTIVDAFVLNLKELDFDPHNRVNIDNKLTPEQKEKRKKKVISKTIAFLENKNVENKKDNFRGAVSLYEHLKNNKIEHPEVDISRIFDEEIKYKDSKESFTLKKILEVKVRENFPKIAADAYRAKLDEDPHGFVMGFMMGRIIRFDPVSKKMTFNNDSFRSLVSYIDSLGMNIENMADKTLYQWLYYDSKEMARHVEEQRVSQAQEAVRNSVGDTGVVESVRGESANGQILFEDGFNVKDFYQKYIAPVLFVFWTRKFKGLAKNPEPKLFYQINKAENKTQVIYSLQHINYFKDLSAESEYHPKIFLRRIRKLLGYESAPQLMQKMERMKDEEFLKWVADFMEEVVVKYKRNLEDAFLCRGENKDVLEKDFGYYEEILQCRDLSKIITWMVSPEKFLNEYPKYKDIADLTIVSHQAMILFKEFFFVSKRVVSPEYVEVYEKRDRLEANMKENLKMQDIEVFDAKYRLLKEVLPNGAKTVFKVIFDDKHVKGFFQDRKNQFSEYLLDNPACENVLLDCEKGVYKDLSKGANEDGITEGRKFFVYPIEKAKFKRVKITVELMPDLTGKRHLDSSDVDELERNGVKMVNHEMEVLIYNGDSHYIHSKDEIARLLSESRGKEVSDENRCLFVFANARDEEIYKQYEYQNNGRDIISIEDPVNNIYISSKSHKSTRTGSNPLFKKNQAFKITKGLAFIDKKKVLNHEGVMVERQIASKAILELQAQSLESLFIHNISHFAPASHFTYRAKRAWSLMPYYFNPQVWGDRYQHYIDQGPMFNGD